MNNKTEEDLVRRKIGNFGDSVDIDEFARILRLDAKDPSTCQLFKIHDRVSFSRFLFFLHYFQHLENLQQNRGRVDLEEYIFTVLAIANAETELDLIDIAFEICDSNGTKCLNAKELRRALRLSLQLQSEESDKIFLQASREAGGGDTVNLGKMSQKKKKNN